MSRLSSTISLCFAFVVLTLIDGTYGDFCPQYGFSCPRVNDFYSETTCCRINGYAACCDPSVLTAWAIGVIVTMCFLVSFVFILIVCACCPCCWLASRRRRSRYVVVSNENPVAYPSTTRTTYVYNYPTAQPNYNSVGFNQATAPPPPTGGTTTTTYVRQ